MSGVRRLKHLVKSVKQGWSPQCYPWPSDGVEVWGVLKAGATNGGVFRPGENKELPSSEDPRPDTVVADGDVIISRANTRELVGSAAVVRGEFPRLMLSDKQYALRLDSRAAVPEFVALVLGTRAWRDLIELEASGSSPSMQNISQADILNLPMPLPDIDSQRRILKYLDRRLFGVDKLLAKQEQLIGALKLRREATVSGAITDVSDELVQLRRLAEVIDCAHVTAEFVKDDRRFPVASIRECQGPFVDLSRCSHTTEEFFDHLRSGGRRPRAGDLLFIRNVSVGRVSIVAPGSPEFAVGQETVLLRRRSQIDPEFLRYALTSGQARHSVERLLIGSTFKRINVSAIRALPVPSAPWDVQKDVVQRLNAEISQINSLIVKAEQFITLAKERRSALITAAVTDQIDVQEAS